MKRFLAGCMVLLMSVTICMAGMAEELDMAMISRSEFYEEDKFNGGWTITGSYKTFKSTLIIMDMYMSDSSVEDQTGPSLWMSSYNLFGDEYDKLTAFRAVVDGTVYSFEELYFGTTHGWVNACPTLKAFCDALVTAKEVAFQYEYEEGRSSYRHTIDPVPVSELQDMISVIKTLEKSHAWDNIIDYEAQDEEFSASIK